MAKYIVRFNRPQTDDVTIKASSYRIEDGLVTFYRGDAVIADVFASNVAFVARAPKNGAGVR